MESTAKEAETKASRKSSKSAKSKDSKASRLPAGELTGSTAVTPLCKPSSGTGTRAKAKRGQSSLSSVARSETKAARSTENETATGPSSAPAKRTKAESQTTEAAKKKKGNRETSTPTVTGSKAAKVKGTDKRKASKRGAADNVSKDPDAGGGATQVTGVPEPLGADVHSSPTVPKDAEKGSVMKEISASESRRRREHRRRNNKRKSLVPASIAKVLHKTMRRHGGGDDTESSMSSRGELSVFMVGMLAVFFFCFLLGLLFYYFFTGPNLPSAVACISDECLKAKESLDKLLNDAKKPCADFYGHVCDSWRNSTSSFQTDVAGRQLAKLNASLFRSVKIKRDEDKRYGIHVLRPVYRSCYRYMSEPVEMKDALKEAHDLLEINQLMKAATFFDVVRYLVRQVMQIGVYTLFKAMFVHEGGRSALFMGQGYTLQEKLGVPFDTGDARQRFEQILKFWLGRKNVEADLNLLVQIDSRVGSIFRSFPLKEELYPLKNVVSGMVPGVSAEQWVLAFKNSLRDITILQPTDEIITVGVNTFKRATQLVMKYGLRKAAFYMATNLEADVVYILSMRDTIAQSEMAKALYCLAFTYKSLTLTWAFLAARQLAEARSIGVLQDIIGSMQEAISEYRDAFVWMEESNRNSTAQALSKLSLHVIAGRAFNGTNVDYNKPDVKLDESNRFLVVLLAALRLHHSVMAATPPTRVEMLISEIEFAGKLALVPSMGYIVVPTTFQHDPYLYNYHVPDYFNYGTMGSLLGMRLVEAVGVGVRDERQSAWDHSTVSKHDELLRCLTERRRHLGFPDFDPTTADKQQTQMMVLSIGARIAYSGLRKVFRKKSRTVKVFNDYWPEAMRVFFARFCLLWCSGSQVADPLTPREKCLLPLYNMEEFSELYHCDANSTGGAVCAT